MIPNTPLRMLIKTFPDLAERVFDKCIEHKQESVIMNFEFLEDTFSLKATETSAGETEFRYGRQEEEEKLCPYDATLTVSMINHPMMIMVETRQKQLLKHPLCMALLRRKWKLLGRFMFYSQLIIYIMFLISVTGFTLYKLTPDTFPDEDNHFQFYAGKESFYHSHINTVPQ